MISGKRFINWIKEAERKHILTLLSFGGYGIYAISYILELSVSGEMASFGIGNGRNLFGWSQALELRPDCWNIPICFRKRRWFSTARFR